ncbi:PREDICTED: lamin tail domain-containing protein 2 isoform X3 [Propithecus coquereli]|uniref:lamin tail domain-containing protein 2 isoform X3 n=1 Tax=Propithecus coquereli TaxID=379532 RepID=UPI00063F773B|nr:PREDICTED: lamin tail domain-containing protein 2 isoform X3 [Propithecus coquereli]
MPTCGPPQRVMPCELAVLPGSLQHVCVCVCVYVCVCGTTHGTQGRLSPITLPSFPGTSGMASESGQEAEGAKEEAPLSLADQEPVSGDLGSPAGTLADPTVPMCPQDTKPHPTRVVYPVNLQLAPESLDPCTLRLLWGQRELEIQALRWAVQNGQSARHCRILQEVVSFPTTAERSSCLTQRQTAEIAPSRSSCRQEKLLQNQVRKLTLELKEQKAQAQREKEDLEERLLQTTNMLQQLEAELQAFQKSCLLRLAQSSWVGRMLRSQTGSVEVVTAETLMDPSDFSDDQTPPAGESFRLEDVDWNSIAHRYPNLFTNMESTSGHKHPRSPPLPDTWGLESPSKRMEGHHKSVEWSTLPSMGTSSSGGADSDSSSGQLHVPFRVQKVTGHPPQSRSFASEQIQTCLRSFGRDSSSRLEDLQKTHSDQPSKTVATSEPSADAEQQHFGPGPSPTGYCLKIVEVSRREKFVRILNQSPDRTADLGGLVLKQLMRDFPVCTYRFPPGTLLAPRHHVTVWGEGAGSTRHQLCPSSGHQPVHFRGDSGRVTLLLSPGGEVLSEHQVPRCVAPVSGTFADNTDLSIDCFPLSNTREEPRRPRPPRKARVREARVGRRRPGWGPPVPRSPPPLQAPPQQKPSWTPSIGFRSARTAALAWCCLGPPPPTQVRPRPVPAPRFSRTPLRPSSSPGPVLPGPPVVDWLRPSRRPRPNRTRGTLPLTSARKFFPRRKVPVPREGAEPRTPELLPAIPGGRGDAEGGAGRRGGAGRPDPPHHCPAQRPGRASRTARSGRRLRSGCAGRGWTPAARWWRCPCKPRPRADTASASSAACRSPRTRAGGPRRAGGSGGAGWAGSASCKLY